MARWDELQAKVTVAYLLLSPPAWPDPHPGGVEAADEEYSRLTDPDRYAVVHTRARVWAAVLADELGAAIEPLGAGPGPVPSAPFDRGLRVRSPLPGTLPLLLLERDGPPAVLDIGVAEATGSPAVLQILPDCGCDACDRGSADLLEAIDESVRMIVGGPLVVLRGRGWHGHWFPDGGSAANTDLDWIIETGRRLTDGADVRLPPGTEALIGRAWI